MKIYLFDHQGKQAGSKDSDHFEPNSTDIAPSSADEIFRDGRWQTPASLAQTDSGQNSESSIPAHDSLANKVARAKEGVNKAPWEVLSEEMLRISFISSNLYDEKYGLIVPGMYAWINREDSTGVVDQAVGQLIECSSNDPRLEFVTNPHRWQLHNRDRDVDSFVQYIEAGKKLAPIQGYRKTDGQIWVVDGQARLTAAKRLGQDVRCWVFDLDENLKTKTRSQIVQQALTSGKQVPPQVMAEIQAIVKEEPIIAKNHDHWQERRFSEFPSIYDQVGALMKAAEGDTSDLERILARIKEVKAKYPRS